MARIREDVAKKKKERRLKDQTVVKCYLSSLIVQQDNKNKIIDAINNRVIAYSKRQVIASLGLNYIIKELFHDVLLEDIHTIELPDILDITFIRQLLLGTDNAHVPIHEVQRMYQRHPYLLQKIQEQQDFLGVRNVYSAASTKFSTNVWNHVWMNFKKRIYRFIDEYIVEENKHAVLYYLMNWKMTPEDITKVQSLTHEVSRLLKIQKDILGTSSIDTSWCKDKKNFNKMLRHSVFVSKVITMKHYNIIPISRTKKHYITIDTSTLYGIVKELELFQGNYTTFESLKEEHWKSFLNFKKLQGRNCTFTYTIETDGTAVCVHFERPKRDKNITSNFQKEDSNTEYWGCDPGRTNIMFLVKKNEDGTFKTLRLSRRQYYKESGITKANEESQKWQQEANIEDADLSSYSSKGFYLLGFNLFVRNYLTHWNLLWKEYTSAKWSIQRMKLYGGKKRVFSNFFNKVKSPNKKTVIGYGSASFNTTAKNEVAVPTSRAYKECCYRFKTVPVDEFRTTKIYHEDGTVLQKVKLEDTDKTVRGLLWYSSTIESKNKFVNRDLNAAINILNCLVQPKRPKMLCRSVKNTKIVQKVGKTILR